MNTVQSTGTGGGGHGGNKKNQLAEELVVSSPSERNWRGIFIALLVIVAVLGLIVLSIVLVSPPEEGPRIKGKKPSLEDIFYKMPPPAKFNGTWISGYEFVYRDRYGGITLYNAENLTAKILMTNSTFRQYNADDFKIANNLKHVLLITEIKKNFIYSRLAKYYIYERATRFKKPLSPNDLDDDAPHLQYASWSPNGGAVAFVYRNDVYYKPWMQKDLVCRITTNGDESYLFNGVPDWLYEEEILMTDHALWFSPDGQYLMYMTFNDTLVGEYKYPWYDSKNINAKYPSIKSVRYPKVETPNPEVSVWIVNLTTPKYLFPQQLEPTGSVEPGSYITSASFYGDHNVALVWLNRRQRVSVITLCRSENNFNCTEFHVEKETKGWTEPIFHPVLTGNGAQMLLRLPVNDGDNGHYMHACQLFANNVIPLTHGAFELTTILAWDEESHLIYAIATNENNPGVRHLFKIGDLNSTQPWTCMTCQPKIDLNVTMASTTSSSSSSSSSPPSTTTTYDDRINETDYLRDSLMLDYACTYNNVIFSVGYKYYVHECLGPNVPVLFLVETATNYRLAVLDEATALRARVANLSVPQIKRIEVEIEDGYKAQVQLFLPQVLREYEDVTFPLILIVNSKPGTQIVSDKWDVSWPWYLASTRNYIVAEMDVRGAGYQGEKMRRQIQNRIGSVEVQDQLAVLTYLRDAFKFVDRTRICTVGKGYGGYVVAMMLLQDINRVINCSVSLSPITNWLNYNSYFTERYLGFPSENMLDYERADLTKRAGNLNDRNYLLVYGSADTTIKSQHSMMFSKALIEQGVLFQQLMYPDENHNFSKKSLLHLYKQIDQFFNDSFGPVIEEWDDGTGFFIQ